MYFISSSLLSNEIVNEFYKSGEAKLWRDYKIIGTTALIRQVKYQKGWLFGSIYFFGIDEMIYADLHQVEV